MEVSRISTRIFSSILSRFYDYEVIPYDFTTASLALAGNPCPITVGAIEIEFQTHNHWWIYLASNYHDSFYYTSFDPTKAIPTQVTGAVGESLAIILMQRLFSARNIRRITPHPSSKTADFEMDVNFNGQWVHTLVESKGSNARSGRPYFPTVIQGTTQLLATRQAHNAGLGYLIITSYPAKKCYLIRVF